MKTQPITGTITGITPDTSSSTDLAFSNVDMDSGAGTVYGSLIGFALPASGGPVAGGTTTNPIAVQGLSARGASSPTNAHVVAGRATQTDWDGIVSGGTVAPFMTDELGRFLSGGIATRLLREKAHVQLTDATETEFFATNANYRHDIVSWSGALLSGSGVTLSLIEDTGGTTIASMQLTSNQPNHTIHFGSGAPLECSASNKAVYVQLSGTGHKVNTFGTGAKLR